MGGQTTNEVIVALMQQKMALFDPAVDTSYGSAYYQTVIVPVITRMGPDITDYDAKQIIVDRVVAYDSEMMVHDGSGLKDNLINPLSTVLEPVHRAIQTMLIRGSWEHVDSMTEEEADELASNSFISRYGGNKSSGSLRLKFASPRSQTITPLNVAYAGPLRFLPVIRQQITYDQMSSQTTGAYYYMDIVLISEAPGDEYNIPHHSLTEINGVTGLIGIEQRFDFAEGSSKQTNTELKEAAETAITVRNLLTIRAITTVLPADTHFPSIGDIVVVGKGDAAMERDIVRGLSQVSGIPGGIKGATPPDIIFGGVVHIGGFTDIWIAPAQASTDIQESVDILDLYDEGALVFSSPTGSVPVSEAPAQQVLRDELAFFLEDDGAFQPVLITDFVIIEGVMDGVTGQHKEFGISLVENKRLVLDAIISPDDLVDASYEIRRRVPGEMIISPDTLVGEEEGSTALDPAGVPYLPVPGKELTPEVVAATRNIGTNNMSLPLFYIEQIEILTDDYPYSPIGETLPEADPAAYWIEDRVSADKVWVRGFWRNPTRCAIPTTGVLNDGADTAKFFTLAADEFYLAAALDGPGGVILAADELSIPGADAGTPFATEAPSRIPRVGDFVAYDAGAGYRGYSMVIAVGIGPADAYRIEDSPFGAIIGNPVNATVMQGIRASDMESNEDPNGLYYFDFIAERSGATQQELYTALATPEFGIIAQGWRVQPRLEAYSHSKYEDVILRITDKVNDTRDMTLGPNIRITYKTTPLIGQVQDFLEGSDEAVTGEDVLARRMPAARVHVYMEFSRDNVTRAPSNINAVDGLIEAIEDAEGQVLNATFLSNVVEDLGADEVTYPFRTIVEYSGKSRAGDEGRGKFMSFAGLNGAVVSEEFVASIRSLFRMAHFIPGEITAIGED